MKSKFLSPYIATPSCFQIICTCCHSAVAQGNRCDRDHMVSQAADTHLLALYRKSLLPPGLSRQRRTRLNEWNSAFSPVSPLKEGRSVLSASEGTVCLPGPSPLTVISCPAEICEVWHPHAQDAIPAHIFEIEALLRDYAVFTRLQKLPEVPGWSLEDRWGERHCSSSCTYSHKPSLLPTSLDYSFFLHWIHHKPFPFPGLLCNSRDCLYQKLHDWENAFSPGICLSFGFPGGHSGKESASQCRRCKRHGFHPCVGMIPWRREWLPTPVFLPGEFHGQRSLVGYSPWGPKESDTTEARSMHKSLAYKLPTYYTILLNSG